MVKNSEKYSYRFNIINLYHQSQWQFKKVDQREKTQEKYPIKIWINNKLVLKKKIYLPIITIFISKLSQYCINNTGCTIESFDRKNNTFILRITGNKLKHYDPISSEKLSIIAKTLAIEPVIKEEKSKSLTSAASNHLINNNKPKNFDHLQSFVEVKSS
jgi:hypothetical protein